MEIYHEEIRSPLVSWLMGVFGLLAAGFGGALVCQTLAGPIGRNPAPNWFWGLMLGVYLAMLALLWNFRQLTLLATETHFSVGFGAIRRCIPWENVAGVREEKPSLFSYGGVGWRIGRRRGKWVMAFVDFRSPRLVLELRTGRFQEIVFSTRDPARLRQLIESRLRASGEAGDFPDDGGEVDRA